MDESTAERWRVMVVAHHFLWSKDPIRPADLADKLGGIMLLSQNLIEDANFNKVVPNRYIVELNPDNYRLNYRPIEARVIRQWRERLVEDLELANARRGRREYSFGSRVEIQLRAGPDLAPNQARIYCAVGRGAPEGLPADMLLPACLELSGGEQRWQLHRGIVTLGRDPGCDIRLDSAEIRERRLISVQHAFIECDERRCILHDGAPSGRASTNGTYLNGHPVPPGGLALQDGDLILLAAADRADPRPDAPGVAALHFRASCQR